MSGFRHCGRRGLREYFVVILQVFTSQDAGAPMITIQKMRMVLQMSLSMESKMAMCMRYHCSNE